MVISPSLMYPEGVANTNISLAIAEVPRLMIDCDEGSQQMREALQNTYTPLPANGFSREQISPTSLEEPSSLDTSCQYQDLFTELLPTTQAQGIWNGLNIETKFYRNNPK